MSSRDTTNLLRPDYSDYVVHFTKDQPPWTTGFPNPSSDAVEIGGLNAQARFQRMLELGVITATPMPWTNKRSVCFTECVWSSLLDHARHYSRYGIGFRKKFLFDQGGGPAGSANLKAKRRMRAARSALVRACGAASDSFQMLGGSATISGVGFFDVIHGHRGVAPNGIELHPILSFTRVNCRAAAPPPPPPPPSTNCAPSHPDVCIPPPPPDLDCADIPYRNFRVIYTVPNPDTHHFDGDRDGVGCET